MTDESVFAPATDAHVHLMPERLLAAIREVLAAESGWSFDHPTAPGRIERLLRQAGVERYFALPYAHEPGIAADLNEWVLDRAADSKMAVPFATVHGEDDVAAVVRAAFDAGARGLKFQCPVQNCSPADPRLDPAFELAAEYDRPIVFHAGTAPMFEDSPHVGVDQFESFLASYPNVRACVAHLGTYEHERFIELARDHESVFLDTTMAMSPHSPEAMGFDPAEIPDDTLVECSESIMYGSDFPNIPYPYEAERAGLLARELPRRASRDIFADTADRFLGET